MALLLVIYPLLAVILLRHGISTGRLLSILLGVLLACATVIYWAIFLRFVVQRMRRRIQSK